MILAFDTETTGLPDFRAPSSAPHQPHLVQLAAVLTEGPDAEPAVFSRIVRPDGYTEMPVRAFEAHGIRFEVKKLKGLRPIGPGLPALGGQPVHVHVPNVGLLFMTEVKVMEDACTDALQEQLNIGWRILCVCPPNSQRRPDYILGRAKPGA